MTRRLLPACALALSALLVGCASTDEVEVWRFAIEEAPGSVQHAYATRFKRRIEARTEGRVRVVVYPYGALGTSDQITEQLHNGTLNLAMSSPGHLGKLIPEMQVFLLHYVLSPDSTVNARALADPALRASLDALYGERGLAFLTAFGEGQMVWTTQDPVRRPEDLDGVRFRVMTSPLLLASYEAYGATPTPLPYGEVYSGLQLSMIDAQVNPLFAIEEMSFYEVTDHLVFPRHNEFVTTVAANPAWLEGMGPEREALVRDVIEELQVEILEVQQDMNGERLARMRERKPELGVIELDAAERERFAALARPVRDRFVRRVGARGQALIELLERAVERASAEP